MLSRPRGFIAVATWLGIVFFLMIEPMTRGLTGYTGPTTGAPASFVITELGLLCFTTALVVSLVQCRAVAIWLSLSLAVLSTASFVLRLPSLLAAGVNAGVLVASGMGAALNAVSAWYLWRPSVRAGAEAFRRERFRESMRRHAERQVRKEARW